MTRKRGRIKIHGKLSTKGRQRYDSLNKATFKKISFELHEKIIQSTDQPSYEENEQAWIKDHEELVRSFDKSLHEKGVSSKSTDLYEFIISFYLDEVLHTYGKHIRHFAEFDMVELIFDRYLRKAPLSPKELRASIKAIHIFYKFLLEKDIISEYIYNFVVILRKYRKFFERRVENRPSTGFFWDVETRWYDDLSYFQIRKLQMNYSLLPTGLEHQGYVGMIESELGKILKSELNKLWSELISHNSSNITDVLREYTDKWSNEPKDYLDGMTPKDWIIIERAFTEDIPF